MKLVDTAKKKTARSGSGQHTAGEHQPPWVLKAGARDPVRNVYLSVFHGLAEWAKAFDKVVIPYEPPRDGAKPGMHLVRKEDFSEAQTVLLAGFFSALSAYEVARAEFIDIPKAARLPLHTERLLVDAVIKYELLEERVTEAQVSVFAIIDGKRSFDERTVRDAASVLSEAAELIDSIKRMTKKYDEASQESHELQP